MTPAEQWAADHYGATQGSGPVVRMTVEYLFPERSFAALAFDIPIDEWRPDFAHELVKAQFAELARHMADEHPAEAAAIRQAIAGMEY